MLLNQATDMRTALLEGESCTFQAQITADYADLLYTFQLDCIADQDGTVHFSVSEPSSIFGISGHIKDKNGALTFDDKILAFPLLADGELTPISAPWIFFNTLRSGYLTGCERNGEEIYLYVDDSYEEHPLQLVIQADAELTPKFVEIIWQNRRILSMYINNFTVQ